MADHPYPPPPDVSKGVPQDHKQCDICRMIRHHFRFGPAKRSSDSRQSTCRDCLNQDQRLRYEARFGRNKPLPDPTVDQILRSLDDHNLQFLKAFFSTVEYSLTGPSLNVPKALDYTYSISRIPNSALVELKLWDGLGDARICSISLLHQNIDAFIPMLQDFRLEMNSTTMHMAKLYIYNRP